MPTVCPFCRHEYAAAVAPCCPLCGRDAETGTTGRAARAAGSSSGQVGLLDPATRVEPIISDTADILARLPPKPTRPTPSPAAALAPAAGESPPPPPVIPGYAVERVLGRGGMGTVYLARQESLDRPVALKVMSKAWANDAIFLARFVREAYAAAQLNHPNIVQIHDIGTVDGTKFFSMEYVPGRSLADVLKAEGKLDPETAVGYVLQAARGLKHAHDRGMIHRDIKPDNLLLSDQGIVKVADLGLVKTPDLTAAEDSLHELALPASDSGLASLPAEMTGARIALGTPAYMSPEQCRDAANVDHRADVYSLGCTLYALVTGRPPFAADTAVELMTKQAYHAAVPPEQIAGRVPKELSAVIQKMMAKDPGDRYQTMGEVVRVLEQWLGVHHTGTYSPREAQIAALESCVAGFNYGPAVVLRERIVTGFLSGCLLAAVILAFFGRLGWAFGVAGMVVQAAVVYFLLAGVTGKTYLFRRLRQFGRGLSVGDALVTAAGVGLFGVFLYMLDLFWVWAGFGLIGAGLAFGLRFALDQAADDDRVGPLKECHRLLRKLRSRGLGEEAIRQFVAKYAGRHWEEFFEALFGFEAKLAARALLLRGGYAGEREKYAAWREPLIGFIDRVEKGRREARERAVLVMTEQARLTAGGLTARAARREAERRAEDLVRQASAIRTAESRHRMRATPPASGAVPNVGRMLAGQGPPLPPAPPDSFQFLARLWLGPHVRGALAAVLLAGCAAWAVQNADALGASAAAEGSFAAFREAVRNAPPTRPLDAPGVPAEYVAWCDSANAGWAGVLLLASLFYRGHRMGLLVLVGAAVTVFGHRAGIRTVEPFRDYHVALMLGTVLALVGFRFGRR